jgi:hypothetical protein
MMARELPTLPKQTVTVGDLHWSVEGAREPKVSDGEDAYHVEIPIGTASPMECFAYKKGVDPAAQVRRVMTAAASASGVEIKAVQLMDVFGVGSAAGALFEAAYVARKGTAFGLFKVLFVANGRASVLCEHDEPGYVKTFRRIGSDMATEYAKAAPPDSAEVTRIWLARAGDVPIGFSRQTMERGDQARSVWTDATAMYVQTSPTSFNYLDYVTREVLDARSRIVEFIEVRGKNGKIEDKFHLARTKDPRATYILDGRSGDTPLAATLIPKDPDGLHGANLIDSEIWKKIFIGRAKELPYEVFDSDHPSSLHSSLATVESLKDRTVRLKTPKGELVVTFNAGESTRAEGLVNGVSVVVTRVVPPAGP